MQTITKSFTAAGRSAPITVQRGDSVTALLTGTFVADVYLKKQRNGGAAYETVGTILAVNVPQTFPATDYGDNVYVLECVDYTSGPAVGTLTDGAEPVFDFQNLDGDSVLKADGEGVSAIRVDGADRAAELVEAVVPAAKAYAIDLTGLRQAAAMKDALPDAPNATTLGLADAAGSLVTGTQTNGGTTAAATETAAFQFPLPAEYQAGGAVTVRVRAKVSALQEVADTVDVAVKKVGDAGLGADICATAAQALTAEYADYDFTVTPTGLAAGDVLNVVVTLATDDTGGTQNGTPTIAAVTVLPTVLT